MTSTTTRGHYLTQSPAARHGAHVWCLSFLLFLTIARTAPVTRVRYDSSASSKRVRFLRVRIQLESNIQAVSDPTCSLDCCEQFEASICPGSRNHSFWLQIFLVIFLISASSIFAGLTLVVSLVSIKLGLTSLWSATTRSAPERQGESTPCDRTEIFCFAP